MSGVKKLAIDRFPRWIKEGSVVFISCAGCVKILSIHGTFEEPEVSFCPVGSDGKCLPHTIRASVVFDRNTAIETVIKEV